MKNITLKIDDETYRSARIVAAKRDRSVSALVRDYLKSLAESEENGDANSAQTALSQLWELADQREQPGPAAMTNRADFYDEQIR